MKLYKDNIAREKLQLLIRNDRFIKLVGKIRVDFGIPQNGFDTKNNMAKWNEDIIKPCKSKDEIKTEILYSITITNKLENALKNIMCQFKLSNFYANSLLGFILYNKLNRSPFNIKSSNVGLGYEYNEQSYPHHKIIIEVFSETTQKDIDHVWPIIKKMKKHINKLNGVDNKKRNRMSENLDVYLLIWDLTKKGKNDQEIKNEIKKQLNRNIPYNYIPVHRKTIKEKIEKL